MVGQFFELLDRFVALWLLGGFLTRLDDFCIQNLWAFVEVVGEASDFSYVTFWLDWCGVENCDFQPLTNQAKK